MAASQLCGSFPADTAGEVYRTLSGRLGGELRRMPDGETGDRAGWFASQLRQLCTTDGIEMGEPLVVPGVREFPRLRFTRPFEELELAGLGYFSHARASWAEFQKLRGQGVIPSHVRFQVCFPTPVAVIGGFVSPPDQADFEPVYEAALERELKAICSEIPHDQLAIQWDVAIETALLENTLPHWFGPASDPFDDVITRLVRLGEMVPSDVELGYHLCYGNYERQHFKEPQDLGLLVAETNTLNERLSRPITWVHMPVPIERSDPGYFHALTDLQVPGLELYLGVVHGEDGVAGAQRRIDVARRALDDEQFLGVATECGMGQEPRSEVDGLLSIHAKVRT